MLSSISKWWHQEERCEKEPELELAITKLMVGMMAMDGKPDADEYAEVSRHLSHRFSLSAVEVAALIEEVKNNDRTDLRFDKIVKQIEAEYSVDERALILEQIWSVATADGDIDFLEEQYINRLSGLIGVPTHTLNQLKEKHETLLPNLNQSNRNEPKQSSD